MENNNAITPTQTNNNNKDDGAANTKDTPQSENLKPKPENDAQGNLLNLKLVDANGLATYYKIKDITPLSKLFSNYASRMGIPLNQIRFMHDGQRILNEATARSLDLEDNDVIDVMSHQTGGHFYFQR